MAEETITEARVDDCVCSKCDESKPYLFEYWFTIDKDCDFGWLHYECKVKAQMGTAVTSSSKTKSSVEEYEKPVRNRTNHSVTILPFVVSVSTP